MHASPFRSIKQLFLLHRHQGGELSESFAFIRKLYFDQILFVRKFFLDYPDLDAGDRADLVIWDYRPPSPFAADTFWGHLIYGMLDGDEPDIPSLSEELQEFAKTVNVILGKSLYSDSWLEV